MKLEQEDRAISSKNYEIQFQKTQKKEKKFDEVFEFILIQVLTRILFVRKHTTFPGIMNMF